MLLDIKDTVLSRNEVRRRSAGQLHNSASPYCPRRSLKKARHVFYDYDLYLPLTLTSNISCVNDTQRPGQTLEGIAGLYLRGNTVDYDRLSGKPGFDFVSSF